MRVTLETFLANEHFNRAMARLAMLRPPVDEFFDRVTVNVDEKDCTQEPAVPAVQHPANHEPGRRLLADRRVNLG